MKAAPPLVFPGGRALAAGWRQLTSYRPRQLWAGYLLLHRVEAFVAICRPMRLTPFDRLVLQALTLSNSARRGSPGRALKEAEADLHLGPQVLRQVLRRLQAEGLAREEADRGTWEPTAAGREALAGAEYPRRLEERRSFCFVESGLPGRPPHFLSLKGAVASPWPSGQGWEFNADWLRACFGQPPEWKRVHGFPEEVCELLAPPPEEGKPPDWQRIILDRPEHLPAAIVRIGDAGDGLLGFAARPDNWSLQAAEPIFSLSGDWPEVFPGLSDDPPLAAWRQAWQAWCRSQNLPAGEADACSLEHTGHLLRVTPPARLLARLRSARSEALRGEAWLLAGDGPLRSAAVIEIVQEVV